jgi:methyl-accepting chemotaxis protein
MVDNISNLLRGVMTTADQVAASAEELSATSGEAERAINQIAATITDFAQGAHNQTEEIEAALKTADQPARPPACPRKWRTPPRQVAWPPKAPWTKCGK